MAMRCQIRLTCASGACGMVRCMRKPVGTGQPALVAGPAPLATPDSLTDFESFWVEIVWPAAKHLGASSVKNAALAEHAGRFGFSGNAFIGYHSPKKGIMVVPILVLQSPPAE